MIDDLLRPETVARAFGVSTRTILRWCAAGELRHVRIGKVVRLRPADVEAFIESHAERTTGGAEVVQLERREAPP